MSDRAVHPYIGQVSVVEASEPELESGLYIPINALNEYERGVVAEVGPGVEGLEQGCLVYYHRGHSIEINDVRVLPAVQVIAWEQA